MDRAFGPEVVIQAVRNHKIDILTLIAQSMEIEILFSFVFFILFLENVGSMSQEITKEESQEQENLHNSFAYNSAYNAYKTHSNGISIDKNQDSALECYECNSIGDGELCTYSSHIFTSSELS